MANHEVFFGRTRELGQIRTALDRRVASIIVISGMRGIGRSALARRAVADYPHLAVTVPSLPAPLQLRAIRSVLDDRSEPEGRLAARPEERGLAAGSAEGGLGEREVWRRLFDAAHARLRHTRTPTALVLDDSHRLDESKARYAHGLKEVIEEAREEGRPWHVVLVRPTPIPPGDLAELVTESVVVEPLPLRQAAPMLPGATPEDTLRAYALFGGIPLVLSTLDRTRSLDRNVRRLLLDGHAPFADVPAFWLERDLQAPGRYNAIMAALARGPRDWSELHAGVPDLTSSGQLAPYVRRLEQLGLVRVTRSLDASPESRARRYELSDPFLAFWYRWYFASRPGVRLRTGDDDPGRRTILPVALEDHLARVFPAVCRQHMSFDAIETLGANAREVGSLWSPDYDVPVAGILLSGSAFYGTCLWDPPAREEDPLGALHRAIRETRYGFGRQRRLRLIFSRRPPPRWLERAIVRGEQSLLIGAAELLGDRQAPG